MADVMFDTRGLEVRVAQSDEIGTGAVCCRTRTFPLASMATSMRHARLQRVTRLRSLFRVAATARWHRRRHRATTRRLVTRDAMTGDIAVTTGSQRCRQ
jgi:hypothetical protein